MAKKILVTIAFLFIINSIRAQSELEYNLDSLIVIANRISSSFSEIGRTIDIINLKEIKNLPITTIPELLEQSTGIDIKKRGINEIQSDISIRGGTFEQTLILIDGIKLIDPQTGHHNMNLPISLSQIERIEILKGQGSGIHGANAFSGVINIITKRNSTNTLNINLQGGDNSFYKLATNGSFTFGKTNHHINFSKSKSDGYKFNTAFENYNFSVSSSYNLAKTVIKSIYGITYKNFGANSFYTIKFPKQAEQTKIQLAAISADIEFNNFNFSPKIYWRKNIDEFVLDKDNPAFYKNNHLTNVLGIESQITTKIFGGTTNLGLEYNYDDIKSNNLGQHNRIKLGITAEQKINIYKSLSFNLSGYLYNYSNKYSTIGWKFWPGINIAYSPTSNIKFYTNFGRAFRIPNYTELFYNDPVTKGNANLKPEESTNYEGGFNYKHKIFTTNISFFRKEGSNLIDYVMNKNSIWKAKNITTINTNGFEFNSTIKFSNKLFFDLISKIKFGYTYLTSDKIFSQYISRYTLRYLRHSLKVTIFTKLPFNLRQSWALKYGDRINLNDYFTIDTKLQREFDKFNIFIQATNLLNKPYEEIPGVLLPGRFIVAGINFKLY